MNICEVVGCEGKPVVARGWCKKHYRRWQRHGDPLKLVLRDEYTRFDAFVNKTDTCWLWLGGTIAFGYGHFKIEGKTIKAHRYSYERYVGPIPDGLFVLHKCDVPGCVNPYHLELGDAALNQKQKAQRGRSARGVHNGNARRTEAEVIAIRAAAGTQKHVAAQFGITQSRVSEIVRRKTWNHI